MPKRRVFLSGYTGISSKPYKGSEYQTTECFKGLGSGRATAVLDRYLTCMQPEMPWLIHHPIPCRACGIWLHNVCLHQIIPQTQVFTYRHTQTQMNVIHTWIRALNGSTTFRSFALQGTHTYQNKPRTSVWDCLQPFMYRLVVVPFCCSPLTCDCSVKKSRILP